MKKIIIILISLLVLVPNIIFAKEINIYLFHGKTCPHCLELKSFLKDYLEDRDDIILNQYEVWNDDDNYQLFTEIQDITNVYSKGVPYLIIGDKVIVGYNETTSEEIINTINYYLNVQYEDKIQNYIENRNDIKEDIINEDKVLTKNEIIESSQVLDSIKNILKKSSNLINTIVLGLISTFNISFLLVSLLFIVFLLICREKKTRLLIGLSFLLSIFISNTLLLTDIIDTSIFLDKTLYIKIFIGFIVSIVGIVNLLKYFSDKVSNNDIVLFIVTLILFMLSNIIVFYNNMEIPILFNNIIGKNFINVIIYTIFSIILISLIYLLFIKVFKVKKNKYKYVYLFGNILLICSGIIIMFLNN